MAGAWGDRFITWPFAEQTDTYQLESLHGCRRLEVAFVKHSPGTHAVTRKTTTFLKLSKGFFLQFKEYLELRGISLCRRWSSSREST